MPVNASVFIMLATVVIAITVWMKTKRIGSVVGVVITGMVIIAATDAAFLTEGANAVKKLFRWAFKQFTG